MRKTRNNTIEAEIIRAMVCVVVYGTWNERNNRRFKSKQHTALQVAHDTMKKMKNYLQQVLNNAVGSTEARRMASYLGLQTDWIPINVSECVWQKPRSFMLNPDGTLQPQCGDYERVIIDKDGQVLRVYNGSSKYRSILLKELLGIME
ncbi:hypothetical protein IFM89_002722 [Coptis chinensis]|uniref:Uncharacterized protein n=1 Tax=Coptis chinensis TaxID=261450 RepID=A0A835IKH5_9MAGN|nr:hypothetical protein IFM89_002722 [Coptis chinensis]